MQYWHGNKQCLSSIGMVTLFVFEVCHGKTDLKIYVVVIPKKWWARVAAPNPRFVLHRRFKIFVFLIDSSY